MYDDAYTIQGVTKVDVANFNYVAGMVPFLFNLIQDVSGDNEGFIKNMAYHYIHESDNKLKLNILVIWYYFCLII